ncbi:MAG: lytic murein transglycosylase [Parcubacteria group bacterium]|nr:lytic murein transglycosylase [Parcubacteria group bacterium]
MLIYDIKPRRKRSFGEPLFPRKRSICLSLWERSSRGVLIILTLGLLLSSAHFAWAPSRLGVETVHAVSDVSREELEAQLREIEKQIASHEENIRNAQADKKTLSQQISILESKARKLTLQIRATDLQIRTLSQKITETSRGIERTQVEMNRAKALLEQSIQTIYERDQLSLLEVLMANAALSDFFSEVSAQDAIQMETQRKLDEVRRLRAALEEQREELVGEREDQQALYQIQDFQRKDLNNDKAAKDQLLAVTKGKESAYQDLLRQSQKSAAEIRSKLYRLLGGGEINFGDAVRYAEFAASATGVRPALLLAVLDKESALGRNVGRCSWKTAMHPRRDQPAYLEITAELGMDPDSMLVSCPILSDGSYGGAMGPAQFLPSTWNLYKERIRKIVGRTPSPWNPQDAFIASALYLADAGATRQTFEAERQAAAKYYAGSRWKLYLRSYGARVMELAQDYQSQIEILKRTASL